jgi:hypothetical protein
MKFIYIDESGSRDQGDVFVTCGLMVDAYKLRKKTEDFDQRLEALFAKHPGNRADFKTSRFINGSERSSSRASANWLSRMVAKSSGWDCLLPLLTLRQRQAMLSR